MMETDIAVGSGLKVTCDRDRARRQAGDRFPRRLVPRLGAGSLRRPVCGPTAMRSSSPPPTWSFPSARRSPPRSRVTARSSSRESSSSTWRGCCRPLEVTIEYRPEDGVAHISSGSYSSKLNVFSAEDFPRLPVGRRRAAHDRHRLAARDRRPRRPFRLEGRVTAGADGNPGALRGHAAAHGRDRLVPALVQGDGARAGRPRPRGDHPGPRAHRARPDRRRHRDRRARRQREHGRVRHRATRG